jgi:hypothetical protein
MMANGYDSFPRPRHGFTPHPHGMYVLKAFSLMPSHTFVLKAIQGMHKGIGVHGTILAQRS